MGSQEFLVSRKGNPPAKTLDAPWTKGWTKWGIAKWFQTRIPEALEAGGMEPAVAGDQFLGLEHSPFTLSAAFHVPFAFLNQCYE